MYLRYYESDMTLHVESDTSYLVLTKTKSQIASCFFFKTNKSIINSHIHIEHKIFEHVVSSAAKAESGGIL